MANVSQFPIESHLTPREAHTFSRSNEWWRGIVRSEDEYGNKRIRLYLWRDMGGKEWEITHKWNVQEGRWEKEKAKAEKYLNAQPSSNHPYFPVQHYKVVGGETITKNDAWWTAIVQFETDYSSTHKTRLYMWDMSGGEPTGISYKWNVNTDTWSEEVRVADAFLKQ